MDQAIQVRCATPEDLEDIGRLRVHSARTLTEAFYSDAQLNDGLSIGRDDHTMVASGRFFVATRNDLLIGCAAWCEHANAPDTAVIRSVFVDPEIAARGLGRRLMAVVEAQALANGFSCFALQSSLSAVGFYQRLGYQALVPGEVNLNNGVRVPIVHMRKALTDDAPAGHDLADDATA